MTERWRARPQTARARISNPVSGGQCDLIHLIIHRGGDLACDVNDELR